MCVCTHIYNLCPWAKLTVITDRSPNHGARGGHRPNCEKEDLSLGRVKRKGGIEVHAQWAPES